MSIKARNIDHLIRRRGLMLLFFGEGNRYIDSRLTIRHYTCWCRCCALFSVNLLVVFLLSEGLVSKETIPVTISKEISFL
ncbi:unnamed protein product [Brassica oleracea var. botrytis]|uniref:Uncharacterized protein n=2 Tax=Brassica oleracea TaxID=3712 RepID=A0A0D3AXT7_BRAOL|nr:unnamed protein product [Brassica oleracea]